MINYLKNLEIPKFSDELEKNLFFNELDFWGINIKLPEKEILKFDSKWCPSCFTIDKTGTTLSKMTNSHGIVLLKRKLSSLNPFIEFSISLNNRRIGTGKIILALVDIKKFKKNQLSSSFEKNVPFVFFWDIYNGKILKQCEGNYRSMEIKDTCKCYLSLFENKFGLKYDYLLNTIELFRNDINLGVVIKNIPTNLTPALEINIEDCKIQLSSNNFPQERFFL